MIPVYPRTWRVTRELIRLRGGRTQWLIVITKRRKGNAPPLQWSPAGAR